MRTRNIGGVLDLAALDLLSGRTRHRPSDTALLRAAAVELRARGLTPRDIGQSIGLSEDAARLLLQGGAA
ncbi:MAG TPA: hypothetical protein VHX52_14445 [Steroidobacteraceae bacterium]|jgi:hypothetical protein|nr:hypothetical protein [Steroidobacteraceae bacterium]